MRILVCVRGNPAPAGTCTSSLPPERPSQEGYRAGIPLSAPGDALLSIGSAVAATHPCAKQKFLSRQHPDSRGQPLAHTHLESLLSFADI